MTELEELLGDCLVKLEGGDAPQVHGALQKLDALLARLSSEYSQTPQATRKSSSSSSSSSSGSKKVVWKVPTANDKVFGEFVRLQDGFEYNLARVLTSSLRFRRGDKNYPPESTVLLLTVLQGVLLVHPPSRRIFTREPTLKVILDCISPGNPSSVVKAGMRTLVSCLVRSVPNIRAFERLEGPELVCACLKGSVKEVRVGALEFLFFYLIPETTNTGNVSRTDGHVRRSTGDKAALVRPFLPNVDELVAELYQSKPFGSMKIDW